jgi:hypothetical protein
LAALRARAAVFNLSSAVKSQSLNYEGEGSAALRQVYSDNQTIKRIQPQYRRGLNIPGVILAKVSSSKQETARQLALVGAKSALITTNHDFR